MERKLALALVACGLFIAICSASAEGLRVGYGLVFSVAELEASRIDRDFSDIAAGGHSSFFSIEIPVAPFASVAMSPGAMNFESGDSQFHVQYNAAVASFHPEWTVFPVVGAGLGGCIATLTEGSGTSGKPQTGNFLRNSAFLWILRAGVGCRIGTRWELTAEGRWFGFLDEELEKLGSLNFGAVASYRL